MADVDRSAYDNSSTASEERTKISIPPDCQVVFFNDDYTTKDFVIAVLVSVFHKPETEAVTIMETVHRIGSAVVGIYTYDIAATRAEITVRRARAAGFPLRVEIKSL